MPLDAALGFSVLAALGRLILAALGSILLAALGSILLAALRSVYSLLPETTRHAASAGSEMHTKGLLGLFRDILVAKGSKAFCGESSSGLFPAHQQHGHHQATYCATPHRANWTFYFSTLRLNTSSYREDKLLVAFADSKNRLKFLDLVIIKKVADHVKFLTSSTISKRKTRSTIPISPSPTMVTSFLSAPALEPSSRMLLHAMETPSTFKLQKFHCSHLFYLPCFVGWQLHSQNTFPFQRGRNTVLQ
ncbi:hypothetical protein PCANC_06893 [Puccinia coronata f. sp. avenae]|uniref:Uncharacterized protein n=1 Tax=Puccinia coronata f. sp. avenae TaxID=200324 RepID=A0A2N5VGV9_9BASI|nr:hypothetical protein PCANC_06893 [Puccinia coronata f. sp. avenae]